MFEEAVEMARRLGDDAALAFTLSRGAFVDLDPDSAQRLIASQTEVIELARRVGDRELELRSQDLAALVKQPRASLANDNGGRFVEQGTSGKAEHRAFSLPAERKIGFLHHRQITGDRGVGNGFDRRRRLRQRAAASAPCSGMASWRSTRVTTRLCCPTWSRPACVPAPGHPMASSKGSRRKMEAG